jgi:hypothetical protein
MRRIFSYNMYILTIHQYSISKLLRLNPKTQSVLDLLIFAVNQLFSSAGWPSSHHYLTSFVHSYLVVLYMYFYDSSINNAIAPKHFCSLKQKTNNNSTMNLSRGKSASPKPPEKGSFPLDHDSECGVLMRHYMQCLKENEFVSRYCRTYSKQYLQCRMNKYVCQAPPKFILFISKYY